MTPGTPSASPHAPDTCYEPVCYECGYRNREYGPLDAPLSCGACGKRIVWITVIEASTRAGDRTRGTEWRLCPVCGSYMIDGDGKCHGQIGGRGCEFSYEPDEYKAMRAESNNQRAIKCKRCEYYMHPPVCTHCGYAEVPIKPEVPPVSLPAGQVKVSTDNDVV